MNFELHNLSKKKKNKNKNKKKKNTNKLSILIKLIRSFDN
jgi:hypothetical protein